MYDLGTNSATQEYQLPNGQHTGYKARLSLPTFEAPPIWTTRLLPAKESSTRYNRYYEDAVN